MVHRGAGAYECGEETALLTSLEGYRGHPRLKPPFPAVAGLYAKPTIVNNVETISNVPHVLRHGADWYKQWGTPQSTGFRIFCLSGQVQKPGLYELPHGATLRELIYEYGGGLTEEAGELKAIVPGGLSMQLLDANQLDVPMDYESVQKAGSGLGSAAVIVIGKNQSHGRGRPAHPGVLPRGELRQVHALPRGHRLARKDPGAHRNGRRSGGRHRADALHRGHDRRARASARSPLPRSGACRATWPSSGPSLTPRSPGATEQPVIPVRPIYRPDAGRPSGVTEPRLPLEEKFNAPTVKR